MTEQLSLLGLKRATRVLFVTYVWTSMLLECFLYKRRPGVQLHAPGSFSIYYPTPLFVLFIMPFFFFLLTIRASVFIPE